MKTTSFCEFNNDFSIARRWAIEKCELEGAALHKRMIEASRPQFSEVQATSDGVTLTPAQVYTWVEGRVSSEACKGLEEVMADLLWRSDALEAALQGEEFLSLVERIKAAAKAVAKTPNEGVKRAYLARYGCQAAPKLVRSLLKEAKAINPVVHHWVNNGWETTRIVDAEGVHYSVRRV